jgi:hypothetical protein
MYWPRSQLNSSGGSHDLQNFSLRLIHPHAASNTDARFESTAKSISSCCVLSSENRSKKTFTCGASSVSTLAYNLSRTCARAVGW